MTPTSIGQTWAPRAGLCPAIHSLAEIRDQLPQSLIRISVQQWVIDYEFQPFGRIRCGTAQAPWRARPPFVLHLYAPETVIWEDTQGPPGPRHSAWILFTGGEEAGLRRLIHPTAGCARVLDESGELGRVFLETARIAAEWGEPGFWLAQAQLHRAIHLLHTAEPVEAETWRVREPAPGRGAGGPQAELVRNVDDLLRRNLGGRLWLRDVARRLHVSESTLSHRYAALTGESPKAAFIRLKVAQARLLLLKGTPVKTVAAQLGFSSPFHFSRCFRQATGTPPRAFQRTGSL
ncbi:MAG: AraC family transcriptional regulator [Lentisphaeria bacterium]